MHFSGQFSIIYGRILRTTQASANRLTIQYSNNIHWPL